VRIGILTDTHDQLAITRRAVRLLQAEGAEVLVHCGDLTVPDIVHACSVLPSYFVFGNHDADNVPALERAIAETRGTCLGAGAIAELGGKRIAIVHGHCGMKDLLALHPDYLLHGHSHISADSRVGQTRRICPDALNRAEHLSVALLDTDSDELRILSLAGESIV